MGRSRRGGGQQSKRARALKRSGGAVPTNVDPLAGQLGARSKRDRNTARGRGAACPTPLKVAYRDEEEAANVALHLNKTTRADPRREVRMVRPYRCMNHWHVTTRSDLKGPDDGAPPADAGE